MKTSTVASKLTRKYQATVPASVREVLGLDKGDYIAFEIRNGEVTVRKASPVDIEYTQALQRTLSEWISEHDEDAYKDL